MGKPDPLSCRLVPAAAESPPAQVLSAGDNLDCDVTAPKAHGMRAVLVRPQALRPGEVLAHGALLIQHLRDRPRSWRPRENSHVRDRERPPGVT
jgi:FMN phosphatase YigB (HAD superfamily)